MAEKDADNPERLIEYLDSKIKKKEEEEERKNITISKKDQTPKKQREGSYFGLKIILQAKPANTLRAFRNTACPLFGFQKKGCKLNYDRHHAHFTPNIFD